MEMGWYCCRFMHFETLLKHFWNYLGPATSQSDRTANEVAEPYLALPLPAERAHVRAEPPTKKTEKKSRFWNRLYPELLCGSFSLCFRSYNR